MGLEDFRVSLHGRFAADDVNGWVRRCPFARPDPTGGPFPSCRYYRLDNGRHVLEVEVSRDDPVRVSVRFALCNPPSVEPAFLALVGELVARFDLEIRDQEGGETDPERLMPYEIDRFAESTKRAIPLRRAAWVAAFGPEQFPAGCSDAWRWVHERAASAG